MKTRTMEAPVKSFDDEAYTLTIVANSGKVDRVGEALLPEGAEYDDYMRNPVVLWGHDDQKFPIGKANKTWVDKEYGVLQDIEFAVDANPEALIAWRLYRGGFLNAFSVRFSPKEYKELEEIPDELRQDGLSLLWTVWELYETSSVNIPCDANALVLGKMLASSGVPLSALKSAEEENTDAMQGEGVIAHAKYLLADVRQKWAFGQEEFEALLEKGGWPLVREAYAWQVEPFTATGAPETESAYRLAHHALIDGEMHTVFRGVAASMAALLALKALDAADKAGIYAHLAEHYLEFGQAPPPLREYGPIEAHFEALGLRGLGEVAGQLEDAVAKQMPGRVASIVADGMLALGADPQGVVLKEFYGGDWATQRRGKSDDSEGVQYLLDAETDAALVNILGTFRDSREG